MKITHLILLFALLLTGCMGTSQTTKENTNKNPYSPNITEYAFGNIGIAHAEAAQYVTVRFNYGPEPTEFELRSSSDGRQWTTRTLQEEYYWGTYTNSKIGVWSYAGDRIQIRAVERASNGTVIRSSRWSDTYFLNN